MTAERKVVFEIALNTVKDAEKLERLAVAFEKEGLAGEAALLRKRAKLRTLPPEQKQARRDALKKGLQSKDPVAVKKLADAFDKEGATGAAAELRKYAAGLTVAAGGTPSAAAQPEKK